MNERYLAFEFSNRLFAVPLAQALETLFLPALTRVPHAPDWLLGACLVRGDTVSVASLHPFVNSPAPAMDATTRLLLLHDPLEAAWRLGVPVQQEWAFDAEPSQWEPTPNGSSAAVVSAELTRDGRRVEQLSLPRLRDALNARLRFDARAPAPFASPQS